MVSIHAPAKGATRSPFRTSRLLLCFNPRSREGSDAEDTRGDEESKGFNPRSREGSDLSCCSCSAVMPVSIHAPAKGATKIVYYPVNKIQQFQSTLPRRERLYEPQELKAARAFQSTLPRRERPAEALERDRLVGGFNPRSREGSDLIYILPRWHSNSFNPRSREGSDSHRQ